MIHNADSSDDFTDNFSLVLSFDIARIANHDGCSGNIFSFLYTCNLSVLINDLINVLV